MATIGHQNDATLLGLAPELQKLIISDVFYSFPDAFESVNLTCKQLHAIGKAFTTQYNKNVLDFRHFNYQWSGPLQSNWQLMVDVFGKQPGLGRYVQTADLRRGHLGEDHFFRERYRGSKFRYQGLRLDSKRVATYLNRNFGPLGPVLRDSLADGKERLIPAFVGSISPGPNQKRLIKQALLRLEESLFSSRDPICVLPSLALMAMMPNVEELILPYEWAFLRTHANEESGNEQQRLLSAAQDVFVQLANDKTTQEQFAGLQNLRSVYLTRGYIADNKEHATCLAFEALIMFLALKSVTEITVSQFAIQPSYGSKTFVWRYESPSNLRILQLYDCYIAKNDRSLKSLLKCLPKLEVLRLALSPSTGMNLRSILAKIGRQTRLTLKELSISSFAHKNDDYYEEGSINPMLDFRALELLNLELRFLKGYDRTSHTTYDLCLPDVLPQRNSLQKLQIYMTAENEGEHDNNMRHLKTLFNMTAEQQAQFEGCSIILVKNYEDFQEYASRFEWGPLKDAGVTEIRNSQWQDWELELHRRETDRRLRQTDYASVDLEESYADDRSWWRDLFPE